MRKYVRMILLDQSSRDLFWYLGKIYTPACSIDSKEKRKRKVRDKCAINDNTVLFSSLLLDACIVPVSVPVCHLDSRQLQQQPPPSLMNNQQHQLQHQNNPPHLAYQQANHHSYTTVTTSNQHGPSHLPPGGGVMGAHQQGPVPPHLQQQVSPLLFREFLRALTFSIFLSFSCAFLVRFVCFCALLQVHRGFHDRRFVCDRQVVDHVVLKSCQSPF